jgi:hypothetical protein
VKNDAPLPKGTNDNAVRQVKPSKMPSIDAAAIRQAVFPRMACASKSFGAQRLDAETHPEMRKG